MPEITVKEIRNLVGESPIILEVGCNDGTDTLRMITEMPGATIHCFECDPRAIDRFKKLVGNHDQIHLHEMAIADVDGKALFHGSSGQPPNAGKNASHYCFLSEWDLSGSLYEPSRHLTYSPWCTFPEDRICEVSVTRLDTWKESHPEISRIDFIWCDVQGAEASLILGARKLLSVTQFFYTEFYNDPLYSGQVPLHVLQVMMQENGFLLTGTYNDNALFRNTSCN